MAATDTFVPTEYEWLLLRFNADQAARASEIEQQARARASARAPLKVLDLGAGAGANLLYLAPRLPATDQAWVLVDRDAALVERVRTCFDRMSAKVAAAVADDLVSFGDQRVTYQARTGDFLAATDPIWEQPWDLVVANAVFDMLSREQVDAFFALAAERWAGRRPTLYFTINLDHQLRFIPAHPDDDQVRAMFHGHMRRQQYYGRALGPDSAEAVTDLARVHGFTVTSGSSPWRIPADAGAMLHANLDFIERAADEMITDGADGIDRDPFARWLSARRESIERAELSLEVGHRDLLIEWP
ncbi:class I SAM-dependent methyltransferase [Haliangium sp.]|uniref:class I SAM-dependent methyltransferase n=1 Tax=Haliangium sp. TaxID=2663208 RepID=UPI003D107544